MAIKIENERQLNTAQDFVKFITAHNKRALAEKEKVDDTTYDLLVSQGSLINTMAKTLAVKQVRIGCLESEIEDLKDEIKELERELQVKADLLTIAKAIKE